MALISMTGFSTRQLMLMLPDGSQSQVSLSLKTLNSRFFEAHCKLPSIVSHLETDLIKLFKQSFKRGSVYFTFHISNSAALTGSITPALGLVEQYVKAIGHIQEKLPVTGTLTIDTLLSLSGIFQTQETPLDQETLLIITDAIKGLIESVQKERKQEGAQLQQDLTNRLVTIEHYFNQLKPRAAEVMDSRKEQLFKTLETFTGQDREQTQDIQNALVYNQLDKIDIHEEIVRFTSHLENLKQLINNSEQEKGKKIDFTLQELFREINTIAAKCSDAVISQLTINIKVELEKSREQANNIV